MGLKFVPEAISDKIVVKPFDALTQTEGGIFIPDGARIVPQEGMIVSVGPGRRNAYGVYLTPDLFIGDRVAYAKYGGAEVRMKDEEGTNQTYLVIKEDDILCVVSRYADIFESFNNTSDSPGEESAGDETYDEISRLYNSGVQSNTLTLASGIDKETFNEAIVNLSPEEYVELED